jgi:glutamate synthase (ferredoxin)
MKRARRDPLCSLGRSDSSNLDAVFENLLRFGKTPAQSMSMLVPEAYRDQPAYDAHPEIVDMFEYYAGMQEPWDGPALLIFCDGKQLGATLDRNGLRPARFLQTKDGLIGFMSETGVIEVDDEDVVSKGRLGPGACAVLDARPRPLSGVGPLALSAVCWLARCSPIDAMDRYAAAQAT